MANNPAMNPAALGGATRFGEIRTRLAFLIGALVVYRIGTFIPVPGIDPERVAAFFQDQAGTILGVVNMFSGGAMERMSIFAMGVMPYISASIIIQMMSMVVPSLMELRKEGEAGKRKITQLTRIRHRGARRIPVVCGRGRDAERWHGADPGVLHLDLPATITMTTGTMFLMWLGEQITERGIGNGISMIILVSIISGLPGAVARTIEQVNTGEMAGPVAIGLLIIIVGCHGILRVHGARAAPHHGELRQAPGRPTLMGGRDHPPAVQAEHGGRDPGDLCVQPAAVPGYNRELRRRKSGFEVQRVLQQVAASLSYGQPLHGALRSPDHRLRIFLYRAGLQCA